MRPVHKSGSNANYPLPTDFTFSGIAAKSVKSVLKRKSAVNVPVATCLDAWLRYVEGSKSLAGTKAEQLRTVNAIKDKVTDSYKRAAVPLTQELGCFCSFCETPLPGLLEVEHCVPKSQYPMFALLWENFLLACGPCNNAKGDAPSRSTVRSWTGTPVTNEQQYYDEIRSRHYVWADIGGSSHSWLPVVLESYDPGSDLWSVVPMSEAAHLDNYLISHDIAKREVQAGIYDSTSNTHVQRIVRTQLTPAAADPARSNEMLKLCALNDNGKLASTYDRRVLNRTIAWFRCIFSLKTYSVLEVKATQKAAAWDLLLQNSATVGFYSVWLSIIRFNNPVLAGKFVAETNQEFYYPGTDTTSLP